jgi:hypothetical protein
MKLSTVLTGMMVVHGILSVAADLEIVLSGTGPVIEVRLNNLDTGGSTYVPKSRLPFPFPTNPDTATEAPLFYVTQKVGGSSPPYIGAMIETEPPSFPEDYVEVAAGGSYAVLVDLLPLYDMSTGFYDITYNVDSQLLACDVTGTLCNTQNSSNTLTVSISRPNTLP